MNYFYGHEERRIEKISPVIETPPEARNKSDKQENKRTQGGKRKWYRKIQKMHLTKRTLKKIK